MNLKDLENAFSDIEDLKFAVLVGSQASGNNRSDSDWDFALYWKHGLGFLEQLAATEQLRKHLATILHVEITGIDIIDLHTARLGIRSVVAEEGIVLKGAETLAWCHFLQRTWRELEEVYWEDVYAA
ncbi:MAG: nucleotidyltransferase domain-containing protein [Desulfuromonadaceae bacterium]|nr:nucleotidyltransferase domain-containing protein [Desulfuromonadaceae bacterium]